jgi:hypothetical protein
MIIMRCFSVFLGVLIGYLYSFFAYRSYLVLWQGAISGSLVRRFSFVALRLALVSAVLYGIMATGLVDANFLAGGMATGYISFYLLYGVMRWM